MVEWRTTITGTAVGKTQTEIDWDHRFIIAFCIDDDRACAAAPLPAGSLKGENSMNKARHSAVRNNTHEKFVRSAGGATPEDQISAWSRVERRVFNHLIGHLPRRRCHVSNSNEMPYQCHGEMLESILRFRGSRD